jgi:chorismate mutase
MDIDDWRKEIDEIDKKILQLLNKRTKCVINIGKLKKQKGISLYSAKREDEILKLLLKQNKGPLEEINIRNIFEKIIDESKIIESKYCE